MQPSFYTDDLSCVNVDSIRVSEYGFMYIHQILQTQNVISNYIHPQTQDVISNLSNPGLGWVGLK